MVKNNNKKNGGGINIDVTNFIKLFESLFKVFEKENMNYVYILIKQDNKWDVAYVYHKDTFLQNLRTIDLSDDIGLKRFVAKMQGMSLDVSNRDGIRDMRLFLGKENDKFSFLDATGKPISILVKNRGEVEDLSEYAKNQVDYIIDKWQQYTKDKLFPLNHSVDNLKKNILDDFNKQKEDGKKSILDNLVNNYIEGIDVLISKYDMFVMITNGTYKKNINEQEEAIMLKNIVAGIPQVHNKILEEGNSIVNITFIEESIINVGTYNFQPINDDLKKLLLLYYYGAIKVTDNSIFNILYWHKKDLKDNQIAMIVCDILYDNFRVLTKRSEHMAKWQVEKYEKVSIFSDFYKLNV
jgi:hypothetical protein